MCSSKGHPAKIPAQVSFRKIPPEVRHNHCIMCTVTQTAQLKFRKIPLEVRLNHWHPAKVPAQVKFCKIPPEVRSNHCNISNSKGIPMPFSCHPAKVLAEVKFVPLEVRHNHPCIIPKPPALHHNSHLVCDSQVPT